MQELFERIFAYFWGVWRYRWYALMVAWAICAVSWLLIMKMPDKYQASAQVFVNTNLVLPDVVGVGPLSNPQARLNAMSRTLLTRPNLESVILNTDLNLSINNAAERRDLINRLRDNIALTSGRRNDLYTISYSHEDRDLARNIVQAVLTLFVEKTLKTSGDSVERVEGFLDQRVAEKEAELRDLENQLADFKRENIDLLPATGQSYRQYILELEQTLEASTLALQQANKRRDNLTRELEGDLPSFGASSVAAPISSNQVSDLLNGGAPSFGFDSFKATINDLPEQQRLYNLEEQLDVLLVKYTDDHPDVVTLRRIIPELRTQVEDKLAVLYEEEKSRRALQQAQLMSQANRSADDYHYRLRFQLLESQAEVDALQIKLEDAQNRLNTIREKRELLPTIEAELRRFESELSLVRNQLTDMKSRQKRVELGIKVGESEDIGFEVIEPPYVPNSPVGPHRAVLFSGALAVGLAAGLALAFVIAQLRPTFDTRRALMQAFQMPVIGSVSAVLPKQEIRKRQASFVAYCALMVLLFTCYAGLIFADQRGVNLLSLI